MNQKSYRELEVWQRAMVWWSNVIARLKNSLIERLMAFAAKCNSLPSQYLQILRKDNAASVKENFFSISRFPRARLANLKRTSRLPSD